MITRLFLKNFRNFAEEEIRFSPRLNIFSGKNAQGKTNLLEALYFLLFGRSFRTAKTIDLIKEGASSFYLEVDFVKYDIEQTLKVHFSPVKKSIIFNSTEYHSFVQLLGLLHGVLLSPQDSNIVQGLPQIRREYIDLQIAQLDPLYVHYLVRYQRALKQRNSMLKQKETKGIESFEEQLARSAVYIREKRLELLSDLKKRVEGIYTDLSGSSDPLQLDFEAIQKEKNYSELYQKERQRELFLGYTTVGPHRDDFSMRLENREARLFASEGQKRTAAAALRFSEWERHLQMTRMMPTLCIDDFGTSLDRSRKDKLASFLALPSQIFVTTTDAFPLPLPTGSCTYQISAGKISA